MPSGMDSGSTNAAARQKSNSLNGYTQGPTTFGISAASDMNLSENWPAGVGQSGTTPGTYYPLTGVGQTTYDTASMSSGPPFTNIPSFPGWEIDIENVGRQMSSSSQDVHFSELCSPSLSTYSQITGVNAATIGAQSTGVYQEPGWCHTVNIVSAAATATPPTLIKDGYTSVDGKIIAVIPGNQAVGQPVTVDMPFEKALRVEPAPGATIIVGFSKSPFKN